VDKIERKRAYDKARYEANKEAILEQKKAYREANKEAIAEQKKTHYEANKEAILEQQKAHYEANKEAILERNKAYREANKEAIAERDKAHYEANKEAILERNKAYQEANKEKIAEQQKAHYRTPKGKYAHIKQRAKRDEIKFSLPFDLYESQLWGKPCHFCGCEMEVTGLDRKNNDRGYVADNVVPCCWDCNTKKSAKPYKQYLSEIRNQKRDDNT
jgi:phage-related minor tail protein